jgi:hypothetical protein
MKLGVLKGLSNIDKIVKFLECITNLPFRGKITFQKLKTFGKLKLASKFVIHSILPPSVFLSFSFIKLS